MSEKYVSLICGFSNQNGRFDDAIEDIQLRLEEFEHLLEMQQRDVATCLFKQMPQLSQKFEEMESVFDGIDRLELMVARYEMSLIQYEGKISRLNVPLSRIKEDMDRVDRQLMDAESTVEGSGVLKNFVPLIFVSVYIFIFSAITVRFEAIFVTPMLHKTHNLIFRDQKLQIREGIPRLLGPTFNPYASSTPTSSFRGSRESERALSRPHFSSHSL